MKKAVFCLFLSLMLLSGGAALAAGELTIVQESYIPLERYEDNYAGHLFVEITNTGDEAISVGDSVFQILNKEGEVMLESSLYYSYPAVLESGATGYMYNYEYVDEAESLEDISGYLLDVEGEEPYYDAPLNLTVTALGVVREEDEWGYEVYNVYMTIRNDGEDTAYNPSVVFGLYDREGTLLYAEATTMYYAGIPVGQTMAFTMEVDEAFMEAWDEQGTAPVAMKGFAFIEY